LSYAHLHLHTHYSLLDGANKIEAVLSRAKAMNMPAAAMTDHGNMFGTVDFYRTAVRSGVKPIIGCEVYVAPRSRTERGSVAADDYERAGNYHLILLAQNLQGYRNLSRMVSQSYIDGFYYKPRIDKELLHEFNEGILCLSGCLGGEVATAINANRPDIARKAIEEYAGIFGDRYYLEIQDNHMDLQATVNRHLIEVSAEMGIPLVATNDCHYLEHEDHEAHEVLLCIQTGKRLSDESRWKFDTDQLFVKSGDEMLEAFPEVPDAIKTSLDIADRCDLELSFGKHQFPVFQLPEGESLEHTLIEQAKAGLEERFDTIRKNTPDLDESAYRSRLDTELKTIIEMEFAGYFLIVADFINHAKEQGIPVGPGRGSAAGSLVSYALKITDIDPIPYNLLFERFLNPERVSMPDIDVDFCYERRDDVIRYVREKYGHDRVANIITFGTMKGKAAIRDVGRVLEFSFAETDRICKLYPAAQQGRDYSLASALEMEPKLRQIRDSGEREKKLFEYAQKLEGLARHVSKHAAGIVISEKPLVESCPLFVDKDGTVMTQFAGPEIEAIGLIKFDFLGLKTLTLVADTVRRIKDSQGIEIDLAGLPLDDPAPYRLITQADTIGIFQMESGGMRKLLTQIKPTTFEDLIAVLALYRPGPLDSGMVDTYIKRKDGREVVTYPDPSLEKILNETYGVIVYQEQVMQIAQVYGGYSLGQADNLRRVMGKKKLDEMQKLKQGFLDGAAVLERSASSAEQIFQQMETFAAYGFNKSHSAAYALVSFQTAYLKAHYPREFLAALLTLEMGDTDKVYKNLADCRQHGIAVLPPDVNESRADFTVCEGGIRFGLGAVKGAGGKAVEVIMQARADGPFQSLGDFCLRTGSSQVNKRITEGLVKAGAFDGINPSRAKMLAGLDASMAWAVRVKDDRDAGQMGLFGGDSGSSQPEPEPAGVPDWTETERLEAEHEVVGFYISGHPLDRHKTDLEFLAIKGTQALNNEMDQANVRLAGVTNTVRRKNSKKGDRYATFNLEDQGGVIEVIAWPKTYAQYEEAIVSREPVFVTGRLELGEGFRAAADTDDSDNGAGGGFSMKPQIIADEITLLTEKRRKTARGVDLTVCGGSLGSGEMRKLKETLQKHPGGCRPFLKVLRAGETETWIELPKELGIDPTDGFLTEIEDLLGPGTARLR
jgi:DNA polymerase-3 subunit alpha